MSDDGEETDAAETEHAPASPASHAPPQAPTSARSPLRFPKMRRQASPPLRRASAPNENVRVPVQHPLDVTSSDPQKFTQRLVEAGSPLRPRQNARLEQDGRHAASPKRGEKTSSLRTFQDRGQRYHQQHHHGQNSTDHAENHSSDYFEQPFNSDLIYT